MADLGIPPVDVNSTPEVSEWSPLPDGEYPVVVIESDVVPTKKGNGTIAKIKLQVIDGPQKGAVIFHNINLQNPSEVAQRIGREQLADMARAVGVFTVRDTNELHNKPFVIKVAVETDAGGKPVGNKVKKCSPMGAARQAAPPATTQQPQQRQYAAAPAAGPAPGPWARSG